MYALPRKWTLRSLHHRGLANSAKYTSPHNPKLIQLPQTKGTVYSANAFNMKISRKLHILRILLADVIVARRRRHEHPLGGGEVGVLKYEAELRPLAPRRLGASSKTPMSKDG